MVNAVPPGLRVPDQFVTVAVAGASTFSRYRGARVANRGVVVCATAELIKPAQLKATNRTKTVMETKRLLRTKSPYFTIFLALMVERYAPCSFSWLGHGLLNRARHTSSTTFLDRNKILGPGSRACQDRGICQIAGKQMFTCEMALN
jgi:hypothetical protein